ncbi:MAG TPA: Ig-like domain repeat protein [Acidimicrobiales bacterium]|jgi:subtilisin-like proprotein convertase family protein
MKVPTSPVRRVSVLAVVTLAAALFPVLLLAAPAQAATFSNNTAISNAEGPATCSGTRTPPSVYPSTINVSGQTGTIQSVSVTLKGMTGWNNDFDVLLVGPAGQKLIVVSDSGSALMTGGGVTLTFADAGSSLAPATGGWTNGATYKPTDYDTSTDGESFPSPAPAAPYGDPAPAGSTTFASAFNGASANGTWSLYLTDDCLGDPSSITGGWDLNVTSLSAAATTTTVTSSNNPSRTGSNVTFTATVTSGASPVTSGTVTFTRGATTLAANVAVNGSGQAAFTTSTLTEGVHTITATYNGTASFATSNGSVTQTVDNNTVVTGGSYCNTGAITINDNGATTPYPSRIFVTGEGAVSNLTLTVKNVTHTHGDDLDLLLVGPTGVKYVFVSDAGGSPDISNQTLTFDDAAASGLTDNAGGWVTGTWRPSNFNDGTDAFLSPAPAGPYQHAQPTGAATFASLFGGTDPNGTWQLFAHDDALGDTGSFAGGWCLNITSTTDPATTTTVSSSQNPSTTGGSVTFTAHVTKTSDSSNVTVGTVTFKDGATVVSGPTALNGSGVATWTTSSLTEGQHLITASYSGSAGAFNLSSGQVTQTVIDQTTLVGAAFCNTGSFPINDGAGPGVAGTANPYPSQVTVSGVSGSIGTVSVTLRNVTHSAADDIDVLLVGPGGQKFVVVSDAGGGESAGTELSNVTVTFTDAAASSAPDSSPWGSPNTTVSLKPTDHNSGTDEFPSPAPAGPYGTPAPAGSATFTSVFGGTAPAGVWSLYVADDTLSDTGTIGDGWCLNLSVPVDAVNDSYTATQGTPLTVNAPGVLANDGGYPVPTATAISSGTTAQGGTVTLNANGSFTYTAPSGYGGPDSFTYTAGNGATSDTATVNIDVRSAPVITVPADFEVTESPADSGSAEVTFTVTATGNPTPTISCVEGATPVSSPVTLAVGAHTIDCTATNTVGSDSDSFVVTVEAANTAPVADAGGPYTIEEGDGLTLDGSGSSDDDGDTLTYSWDVDGDGTFGDATGVSPTLTADDLEALGIDDGPGDSTSNLKVRVTDGRPGGTVDSAAASLTVSNQAPTAGITGGGTAIAGQSFSLTFTADDPSPTDQAAGFSYTIDWDDGSAQEVVSGSGSEARSHTYTTFGTFNVTVTATDKDGGTSEQENLFVSVAGAELGTDPCGAGQALVVHGTGGNDNIQVATASGGLRVSIGGVNAGVFSPTGQLIVLAGAGNDTVAVGSNVTTPRTVYGGEGNDVVTGGKGNGALVGGDGDDLLQVGVGRNLLIGGDGLDTLRGGDGEDILVTGSTTYDDPDSGAEGLCAIAAEWGSTPKFKFRVDHISGAHPGGANGSFFLDGSTVSDDAYADSASGWRGRDWFLANRTGGGTLDTLDARNPDRVTDL